MPDMSSIAAAIGSLKTAADLTKGFLDLKEAAAVQGKIIELQGVILAAQSSALAGQSEQMTLMERLRELEAKLAKLEAWEAEKKRYELRQVGPGLTAYALKADMGNGEPSHFICSSCYEHSIKSILQTETRQPGRCEVMVCHNCGSDLYIHGVRQPEHQGFKRAQRR